MQGTLIHHLVSPDGLYEFMVRRLAESEIVEVSEAPIFAPRWFRRHVASIARRIQYLEGMGWK